MASDIETVTRVLAEHWSTLSGSHRETVAAEVVAALNLPGVRAQALRDAANMLDRSIELLDPSSGSSALSYVNCTRMDAGSLRAEADRIEGA